MRGKHEPSSVLPKIVGEWYQNISGVLVCKTKKKYLKRDGEMVNFILSFFWSIGTKCMVRVLFSIHS